MAIVNVNNLVHLKVKWSKININVYYIVLLKVFNIAIIL